MGKGEAVRRTSRRQRRCGEDRHTDVQEGGRGVRCLERRERYSAPAIEYTQKPPCVNPTLETLILRR